MTSLRTAALLLLVMLLNAPPCPAQGQTPLAGHWEMIPGKGSDIDLFGTVAVDIAAQGSAVTVIDVWGRGRRFRDSLTCVPGGAAVRIPVTSRVYPPNVFMGLMMVRGSTRTASSAWLDSGRTLRIDEKFSLRGSQGETPVTSRRSYALSADGETLTYTIERSTRTDGPPVRFVLKREGTASAYVMHLEDDWAVAGKLPVNAFLIGLQGLANGTSPRLYFVYPEKWDFLYTPTVFDYYRDKRNFTFTELKTPEAALKAFRKDVKGYIVWDKAVRTSLIVAFTLAGLEKGVVVSADLIPLAEHEGLKPIADFRGKFAGMKDAEIYTWAYNEYWKRCSRDYVVWMGGESGGIMKPGVADFGIAK
ncbi:MAG TPA: GxGYxYP domain-containing protein, partial [Bacteroidota bacterium]|nr:GxGYxYP domain-containing protein [Bacteroidota bacterium]